MAIDIFMCPQLIKVAVTSCMCEYAHVRVASSRTVVQVCNILRQFSPPTVLFLRYIKCAPVQRSSGQGQRV